MIKKVVSFLIVIVFIAQLNPIFANSGDIIRVYPTGIEMWGEEIYTEPEVIKNTAEILAVTDYKALYDYLYTQCFSHSTEIDISSYKIPSSKIFGIYCSFAQQYPELLIKTKLKWTSTAIFKYTKKIIPEYLFENVKQDNEARSLINEKLNGYLNIAEKISDSVEKLLFIHDKMVSECEYDTDYSPQSYHAYGFFVNSRAVCQGYSQAFFMIAKNAGFEVDFCVSDNINHIWNYIKVENQWYHIDATWDDPIIKNSAGEIIHTTTAYHDNFLVTDETIENSHSQKSDWKSYINDECQCVSDTYERNHIFNVKAPFSAVSVDNKYGFYKKIGGAEVLFTSDKIKCGAILNSEIIDDGSQYTIYYYCLDKIDTDIFVGVSIYEGGRLKSTEFYGKGTPQFSELYKHSFEKPNNNQMIKLVIWDIKSLVPYSKAIQAFNY